MSPPRRPQSSGAPKYTITVYDAPDETGEPIEVDLPALYVVCPRCRGAGTHVNPAIDGNGLSSEDFAEDPDFAEDYLHGVYDVACYACGGERVILVVDEARLTPRQREQLAEHRQTEAEYQRDYDSERYLRMAEAGA